LLVFKTCQKLTSVPLVDSLVLALRPHHVFRETHPCYSHLHSHFLGIHIVGKSKLFLSTSHSLTVLLAHDQLRRSLNPSLSSKASTSASATSMRTMVASASQPAMQTSASTSAATLWPSSTSRPQVSTLLNTWSVLSSRKRCGYRPCR